MTWNEFKEVIDGELTDMDLTGDIGVQDIAVHLGWTEGIEIEVSADKSFINILG